MGFFTHTRIEGVLFLVFMRGVGIMAGDKDSDGKEIGVGRFVKTREKPLVKPSQKVGDIWGKLKRAKVKVLWSMIGTN